MPRSLGRVGRAGAVGKAGAALVAVMLLASCAAGLTLPAIEITDVNATLTGRVGSTVVGDVDYWFEWGTTDAYDSVTPTRTTHVFFTDQSRVVEEMITGLDEATTYHYRLCAVDAGGGHGVCGPDMTLTTTTGRDSVTGSGFIFTLPELGYADGAVMALTSEADGSAPVGHITRFPGASFFRIPDGGAVSCLRVEGNRAAIGFMGEPEGFEGTVPPIPILLFVEDNGPSGDRYSTGTIAAPATACPVPTDADFVPGMVGGFPIGPGLEFGDFVVHDHVEAD